MVLMCYGFKDFIPLILYIFIVFIDYRITFCVLFFGYRVFKGLQVIGAKMINWTCFTRCQTSRIKSRCIKLDQTKEEPTRCSNGLSVNVNGWARDKEEAEGAVQICLYKRMCDTCVWHRNWLRVLQIISTCLGFLKIY